MKNGQKIIGCATRGVWLQRRCETSNVNCELQKRQRTSIKEATTRASPDFVCCTKLYAKAACARDTSFTRVRARATTRVADGAIKTSAYTCVYTPPRKRAVRKLLGMSTAAAAAYRLRSDVKRQLLATKWHPQLKRELKIVAATLEDAPIVHRFVRDVLVPAHPLAHVGGMARASRGLRAKTARLELQNRRAAKVRRTSNGRVDFGWQFAHICVCL